MERSLSHTDPFPGPTGGGLRCWRSTTLIGIGAGKLLGLSVGTTVILASLTAS
jgi:hypothetical protein